MRFVRKRTIPKVIRIEKSPKAAPLTKEEFDIIQEKIERLKSCKEDILQLKTSCSRRKSLDFIDEQIKDIDKRILQYVKTQYQGAGIKFFVDPSEALLNHEMTQLQKNNKQNGNT